VGWSVQFLGVVAVTSLDVVVLGLSLIEIEVIVLRSSNLKKKKKLFLSQSFSTLHEFIYTSKQI